MEIIATYKLEELSEGMEAEIQREVTALDIENFAKLTQDFHPLHTSITYANEHGFPNIIAHGLLISSFSSTIIGMKLPGENAIIISQNFKYSKPVFPGMKLSIKGFLEKINRRASWIDVKIKITSISDNQLIAYGNYKVKLRK